MPGSRLNPDVMARRVAASISAGSVVAVDNGPAGLVAGACPSEFPVWFLQPGGLLNGMPLSMADSAAIVRGGYVDLAVVSASQVDAAGNFASVGSIAPGSLNRSSAAADLAAHARSVVAVLPHTDEQGNPNIVERLAMPVDGTGAVGRIVTDIAVIDVDGGLTLTGVAPGWSPAEVQAATGASLRIATDLTEINPAAPSGSAEPKVFPDGSSALHDVPDGATVFIDGFGGPGGMAHYLLLSLRDRGTGGLTIVSNTAGIARVVSFGTPPGRTAIDHSVLIENGQVAKAIASFPVSPSVSRPSEFELAYRRGDVDLELVPQGTLAERLRAGGAGIQAFYTPTGAGTLIAKGKESRNINGRDCILEYGLRADFAIIRAHKADTNGNLVYRGTSRNFNAVMAPAARVTVVEVDEIVEPGQLDPEEIVTPGVFVQRIVQRPSDFTGYE